MWDESRVAENAFEMLKNHNFIVTYFDGTPDMWNTKPPLAVWVTALFMKVFGFSDLVVRLPSAIAALLTSIFVFRFVSKNQSIQAGFFSGMVLISSIGFIGMHVARTGDADSLLVLFVTLYCLMFYEFLQEDYPPKKLYLAAFFLSLALLTKSINALLPLPGLVAFVFLQRKQRIFLSPYFYKAGILSIMPLIIYCIAREQLNPGYVSAMLHNDFGGRYLSSLENHSHGFEYYFMQLLNRRFYYWFYILLIGLPIVLLIKKNKLLNFCALVGFSILAAISFSKTKLDWYDATVYPFFSIVVGISLAALLNFIISKILFTSLSVRNLFTLLFFLVIFYYPYRKVLSYINIKPGEAVYSKLKYGPFMKQVLTEDFHEPVVFYEKGYNSQLLYYKNVYSEKGKNVTIITSIDDLKKGNLVVSCDSIDKIEINNKYHSEVFASDKYCSCLRIK